MEISEIFDTAPAGGHCDAEMAAFALLAQLKIPYQRVEHKQSQDAIPSWSWFHR